MEFQWEKNKNTKKHSINILTKYAAVINMNDECDMYSYKR